MPHITFVVVALAVLMTGSGLDAQRLSYTSGENVSPGYEGWEEDADGSRWFVFGTGTGKMSLWSRLGPTIASSPGGQTSGSRRGFSHVETGSSSACRFRRISKPTTK